MSTPSDQFPESLAAYIGRHPDTPKGFTIATIRPASAEESRKSVAGLKILKHLTEDSPLAGIRAAEDPFFDAVTALEEYVRDSARGAYPSADMQRTFAAWLAAFGSFDDKNSAWLSRLYGKTHPHYSLFKKLLSAEYDRNFAYRACAALRNVSLHQQDVINALGHRSKLDPDTGEAVAAPSIRIDAPLLATSPKMNAKVRAEFAARQRPLDVELLLGAATLACQRVHAGLLVALQAEIEQAVAQCEGWHAEARAEDPDAIAVFRPTHEMQRLSSSTGSLTLRMTAHHLVERAALNAVQSEEILSHPALSMDASDFEAL